MLRYNCNFSILLFENHLLMSFVNNINGLNMIANNEVLMNSIMHHSLLNILICPHIILQYSLPKIIYQLILNYIILNALMTYNTPPNSVIL